MEMEAGENNGRSISTEASSFHVHASSFRSIISDGRSSAAIDSDDEVELQWAAIERLPTFERIRSSLFDNQLHLNDDGKLHKEGKCSVVDVTKLGAHERRVFIDKLIGHIEHDNRRLLQKLKQRIDRSKIFFYLFHPFLISYIY